MTYYCHCIPDNKYRGHHDIICSGTTRGNPQGLSLAYPTHDLANTLYAYPSFSYTIICLVAILDVFDIVVTSK